MLTVFTVLNAYCKQKELPEPLPNDYAECGAIIKHHFLHFWAPKQPVNDLGHIPDAGFLKSKEKGKEFIVVGYPDVFHAEMIQRIDVYYKTKGKARERKRIATKPVKAYSSKHGSK